MFTADAQTGPTILVVDDEPSVLKAVRLGLMFEGYRATTASDGVAALEAITESVPDAVLLDVMMPRMDGLTVLRRLRSNS